MLTEICEYLNNWFCEDSDKYFGTITIGDSGFTVPEVQEGQYVRIVGSVFNDGVIQYGTDALRPETFDGAVWLMKVPKNQLILAEEIMDWQDKYGGVDSKAMSPFTSESFAGYSYSKSGGYSYGQNSTPQTGWQTAYATRLAPWRKL